MSWPLSQDYNEAIQDPGNSFGDAELKTGEAVANALGIPMPRSGNFADVYEVRCPNGSRWAVKCFTREVYGLRERYSEIGKYLRLANLPFTVDFKYLEQGIRVRGQWYPILKMQWIEGFVLNEFVRDNLDKKPILQALGQIWLRMARRLRESYIAHCDLQHGNVLFVPGSTANSLAVKLIDYDGMCVPSLAGTKSGEVGHPAYQHPERLRTGAYNQEVDRFSLLTIATALRCLAIGGRTLWEKYDNGDNLLFRQADLQTPVKSALFQELLKMPDAQAQTLVKELYRACQGPLDDVPLLTDLLPEEKPAGKVSKSLARQPAATQGPDWHFDNEQKGASVVKKQRESAGMQRWVWIVGGSLAACVLLAGLLFWLLPSGHRSRDTSPVAQAPRTPPPVDNSKRKPPVDDSKGKPPVDDSKGKPPVDDSKGKPPPPIDPQKDNPVRVADTPKEPLPLFQADFHNPKSGWPVVKDKPGTEIDYAEGKYHIRRTGWGSSVWNAPLNSPADFVCEVEGRSLGKQGDAWGLSLYQVLGNEGDKQYGIQVTVNASGQVEVAPSSHLPIAKERGPKFGPIELPAIKRGAEWNTVRVVVRGRRVEVYVNGTPLFWPFEVDRAISPGTLALMSLGSTGEGLAEFRRFTVWPAALTSANGMDPSKGEQARNAWLHKVSGKDGWFQRETDKSWIETASDGGQCHFEEVARPANYVELFDRNRTMWLRLYSDRVELRQGANPQWLRLYSGRWVAVGDLPKTTERAYRIARAALEEFRKKVPEMSASGKATRTPATVSFRPSFWQCSDGETILTVDLRGNASYKRVRDWSPNLSPAAKPSGSPKRGSVDEAALVRKTQELAKPWLPGDRVAALKPAVKREVLLLAQLPNGRITESRGRTIVRLVGPDDIGDGLVQAMFDPKGELLRLDIAFANARTKDLCDRVLLASATPSRSAAADQPLSLGCFFDPSAYRFEISALSVEGEPFLKLDQASNPFGHDNFDLKLPHRVSADDYRKSKDYHWWCWAWWQHYGCVSGFRGNRLDKDGPDGWEFPKHELRHHRSLASYETAQGPPGETKVIEQSDGPMKYPHATGQTFKPAFYKDLEECHVAFLFTHGGPIDGFYQVRRGLDVWVVLAPTGQKLGVGNLRHLFLDGCAAFTYRRDPRAAHLVKTWIRQAPANGLHTVCGVDGEASLLDRSGWRYFGHYNKGESISDSWAFALLDEHVENCPATAAYGKTTSESVESLLTGRFSDQRVQAKAVAISLWSGAKTP